jgi:hypothetical protein
MSDYNNIISITLPVQLAEIASKIGRAMDSDSGGADSFSLSADGLTISTSAICTAKYKEDADHLLAHPTELYAYCVANYVKRWGDLEPPTLAECEQFCAGVIRPAEPEPEPIQEVIE